MPQPTPETLSALRRERDGSMTDSIAANRRVQDLETAIREAERTATPQADHTVADLRRQLESANEDAKAARQRYSGLSDAAFTGLGEWLQQTPEELVSGLSDQDPFLMFPVRLETRFARTAAGSVELRVRIWPDDISIALPAGDLTKSEQQAGEQYWTMRSIVAMTPIAGAQADAARQNYAGAWNAIATASGPYRAGWIVQQTHPSNWDDTTKPPLALPLLFNPPTVSTEPRIARADVLPDRFVIVGSFGDKQFPDVIGAAIPDDLALAPDPAQGEPWVQRDPDGTLTVAEPLRWMVDFDAAVKVGMGMRIPLPTPWDTTGFDLLMAIGVRGSTAPAEAVKRVESLLAKHRFDLGCGIVRNGTPTNNTDTAISGWQPPFSESEQLFAMEESQQPLAPTPLGETDGHRLVRLLGLSEGLVSRLPNASATDITEAGIMNRAASFATIVEFVKEFLKPLVDPLTREELRIFFHENVSGRGALPAIRVGSQPYGIVVTSDWNKWTENTLVKRRIPIQAKLIELLRIHRPAFQQMAAKAPSSAKDSANPFERLMQIVGQLASSAQYTSRTTVTREYAYQQLFLGGAPKQYMVDWFNGLVNKARPSIDKILPPGVQLETPLSHLLFTERTNPWAGPIIDQDPKVPLSERSPIPVFDGVQNYLHWLAHASLPNLTTEHFLGPDGKPIAPPSALLYVLLRYSLLTAVEEVALQVASIAGAPFFDVVDHDPMVANIGQSQNVLRKDYLSIDAAKLGLTKTATPLARWVHESATAVIAGSQFAAALAVVTDANASIDLLARLPTARLERLLAEHIDLCSYRMDAWVSALYSHRLEQMRSAQQQPGLYIGSYGWVEHLRPDWQSRKEITRDLLPETLRKNAKASIFESTDNGGFIHAPSLPQAATAAVLRNAYMSHATAAQPDLFSVNLSSARVRVAQTYMEGIRNGQSLAALLGYELERGLHERHPGLELDAYRYVLRGRFPFLAGKLTDVQVGVNAEVVEANNVINGLDLLEHIAPGKYPSDIPGLPSAGSAEGLGILAEIERLRDGMDAVSDVLLAESVHQAIEGNIERAKGSLQALTDPHVAPEPEVLRTPRSARLLTFRIVLALDATAANKWPGTPTPRAVANPAVNAWLAQHLPAPADIQWMVVNGPGPAQMVSASALNIQPIDLILLAGDQLGQLSTDLERLIVRLFRLANKVDDAAITRVAPIPAFADAVPPLVYDFTKSAPGKHSLAVLQPLLERLRRMISQSRAMHALDWLPTADLKKVDPADPTGSASADPNFNDLNNRLDTGVADLQNAAGLLDAALIALGPVQARVDDLTNVLLRIHAFGMPEALPAQGETITDQQIQTLHDQGKVVQGAIAKRLAAVKQLRAPILDPFPLKEPELSAEKARRITVTLQRGTDAARQLFGTAFVIVPLFNFHAPLQTTELNLAAAGAPIASSSEVEEWIDSVSRVRGPVADVSWAMAISEWVGKKIPDPLVVQLPLQAGTPWIGGEFTSPLPEGGWLCVAALNKPSNFSGLQCGLVLDDWTENVPVDKTTTGVSFHFNRPNATAPQALLLAVPPIMRGHWDWEELKGCVREAMELAKLRSVEPDLLATDGYFQGLPASLSEFTISRLAHTLLTERSTLAVAGKI
jgi:hypothetical protein